jgi:hypothetical protein
MIGAFATGIGALVNAMTQSKAIRAQQEAAERELSFRRQQADREEQLQTADRVDAYGNKITYTPGIGYRTELAPIVQALLDLQQQEQLKSLREDAPRNRAARERQDERSKSADAEFQKRFKSLTQGRQKPKAEEQANSVIRALLTMDKGSTTTGADVPMLQALRSGNPQALQALSGGSGGGAKDLLRTIFAAEDEGLQRYHAKANADSESMRAALGFLSSIANGAPNAQLANPTAHNNADTTAANALQQLAQVMGQGATGTASAMRGVTQAAGQTADWGAIFAPFGQAMEQWQTQQQKEEEEKHKRETQGMADMMARMSAGA